MHSRNISVAKAANWILYNDTDAIPDGISLPRWRAIVKYITREFKL